MNFIQALGIGLAAGSLISTYPLAGVGLALFGIATVYAKEWNAWARRDEKRRATQTNPARNGVDSKG